MKRGAVLLCLGVLVWACGEGFETPGVPFPVPAESQPQWETGTFLTPQGPLRLTYQRVDGKRIHQGDMLLPESLEEGEGQVRQGLAARNSWMLWPDGVVPFVIDPNLPNPARVYDAMAHWHMRTKIRFVSRTTETAYIFIQPGASAGLCQAAVGRFGGQQAVILGADCTVGVIIHELGHVVGLHHEQARSDRDRNVIVHWNNIQDGWGSAFQTYQEAGKDGQDIGPYDLGSIMHYGSFAFSRNGAPTLTRLDRTTFVANQVRLSTWDEAGITALYGPPARLKVKYGPAVTSRQADKLDLFAVGEGGTVFHRLWSGRWYNWLPLGGVAVSSPAAVSWGPGRLDVFVRGADSTLMHKWYDNNTWSAWESLGGCLAHAPAVSSWGAGRLDVFVSNCEGVIYHKWFDANGWSAWENMGATSHDGPAAVSWGPGRVDLFIRGTNNALWQRYFDVSRGGWSTWGQLGGGLSSGPAVASWGSERLDVFVRGLDGAQYHKWFDRVSGWSPWEHQGGGLSSAPAADSRQASAVDTFVAGTDGYLYQKSFWNGWTDWMAVP
ncbi:MAG TPA: M12 family metallopeptidase [Myxococcus sp.]|nr:M12 family metallopeptidase [Myxococcus sp.]